MVAERRPLLLALLLVAVFSAPLGAAETPAADARAIIAAAKGKPLVLRISAVWCGWCHKLRDDLAADTEAQAALATVAYAVLDHDVDHTLTQRLGVSTLPSVLLIDAQGHLAATLVGYRPVAEITAAVRALADGTLTGSEPVPLWQEIAWASATAPTLLAALGQVAAEDRLAIRRALIAHPDLELEPLWTALSSERLAIRVDAAAVLAGRLGPDPAYDPFADPDHRHATAIAWKKRHTASSFTP